MLKEKVQSSWYQKLEELLKNQRWKEADDETYRLMITTVGKEEGQWFESEELLNFPGEVLLSIDRLWVKYSEGRFGFSVQKKLYLECGGVADGQEHQRAWKNFCNTNGWISNEGCRVVFDTSSPKGHLPSSARVLGFGTSFDDGSGGFLGVMSVSLLSHHDL